jgi:hypothetical protein
VESGVSLGNEEPQVDDTVASESDDGTGGPVEQPPWSGVSQTTRPWNGNDPFSLTT